MAKQTVPCPGCQGKGRGTLFKDRDPIEGSKMSTLYTCLLCEGEKEFDLSHPLGQAAMAYHITLAKAEKKGQEEHEAYLAKNKKLKKQALAKLTPAERNALGVR